MFKDNFDSFSLLLIQVENRVFVDRCFLFSSFSFFFFWNWREKVILPAVNWKVRLVRGETLFTRRGIFIKSTPRMENEGKL